MGGRTPHGNPDFLSEDQLPKIHEHASQPPSQPASQHRGGARLFLSSVVRTRSAHTVSHCLKDLTIRGGRAKRAPPYSYFLYTVADCVCGTCSDDTAEKQSCGATVLAGWLAGWLAGMFMNFKFPGGVSPPMHPWIFQFSGGGGPPMHPPAPQGSKGSLHWGYPPHAPWG